MDEMITVIVPVYKIKEEFLINCIESLINQGRSDYRIILVDDGSPDNCGAICDEYAEENSIISVIHQDNQGVSVARNSGIKAVDTKWLTFVDADDWVEPTYIKDLYHLLKRDANEADIVMFEYSREFKKSHSVETLEEGSGFLSNEMLLTVRTSTFYKLLINGKTNPYTTIAIWDKVYRADFLRKNEIWFIPEARKGQDRLFNADALNSTSKIYYFDKVLYRYRCWEDSRTNRYDSQIIDLTKIEIQSLKDVIEKHKITYDIDEFVKCRACTRLYTCMRLYYFHKNNHEKYSAKKRKIIELIDNEPFKKAIKSVNVELLSFQERIFVFCLKYHLIYFCSILVRLKSIILKRKLSDV